jgi:hypothetical protein
MKKNPLEPGGGQLVDVEHALSPGDVGDGLGPLLILLPPLLSSIMVVFREARPWLQQPKRERKVSVRERKSRDRERGGLVALA